MILITGASGFIGRHLLLALIKKYGANNIIALTSKPIKECVYLLHHDYTFASDYFVKSGYAGIETIIHAGAFTPKNKQQGNDWKKCTSNIYSIDKLLSAELPNLKRLVYLSTLDVYGIEKTISENSVIKPASLYGESKLYGENMITAWANETFKIYQLLRVGHTYGPGEEAYQKIIPVTIRRLLQNQALEIWGTGEEIRSFIYINDVVAAVLQSLELEDNTGPINLVSSQQVTVRALVEKLLVISGRNTHVKVIPTTEPGRDFVFDNSKMKRLLLSEETVLEDGLAIEWRYMESLML